MAPKLRGITLNGELFCAGRNLWEGHPVFGDRLSQTARLPLFCEIATLLGGVWELICEQNQLPVPEEGAKPEPEDAGTPYECALVEAGIT